MFTKEICPCGQRIRMTARYMVDASDKDGIVFCSDACLRHAMGWNARKPGRPKVHRTRVETREAKAKRNAYMRDLMRHKRQERKRQMLANISLGAIEST